MAPRAVSVNRRAKFPIAVPRVVVQDAVKQGRAHGAEAIEKRSVGDAHSLQEPAGDRWRLVAGQVRYFQFLPAKALLKKQRVVQNSQQFVQELVLIYFAAPRPILGGVFRGAFEKEGQPRILVGGRRLI